MAKTVRSRLKSAAGGLTALAIVATAAISQEEGIRLYVYKDAVGIATYCIGETKDAKKYIGHRFSKDECNLIFANRLFEFETDMIRCVNAPDLIPDKAYIAFLDTAYNIGAGAWCKSSMVRDINAGRGLKACDDLMKYTRAGGRTIQGLVSRRKRKRAMCIEGYHNIILDVPNGRAIPPLGGGVL